MAYAEHCGFDLVGCNEHHFSPYGLMANPNLIAAALTQRTTTAKIAIFGNLVPLNNPIRIAEEYAMLDVMSDGRLAASSCAASRTNTSPTTATPTSRGAACTKPRS